VINGKYSSYEELKENIDDITEPHKYLRAKFVDIIKTFVKTSINKVPAEIER